MPTASQPMTIRTERDLIDQIDAVAAAMERSRNFVVNQALRRYLEANAWQIERVREGVTAARQGRVRPAGGVLAKIAAKHGWPRR